MIFYLAKSESFHGIFLLGLFWNNTRRILGPTLSANIIRSGLAPAAINWRRLRAAGRSRAIDNREQD